MTIKNGCIWRLEFLTLDEIYFSFMVVVKVFFINVYKISNTKHLSIYKDYLRKPTSKKSSKLWE